MMAEFTAAIRDALSSSASFDAIVAILRLHRDKGLTKGDAYRALEALRGTVDVETEDRLLEVLDVVSGYCQLKYRVWEVDA